MTNKQLMTNKQHISRHRSLKILLAAGLAITLTTLWFSTATFRPNLGQPLEPHAADRPPAPKPAKSSKRSDRLLVMLGFSGGGTRAAALSYGVLQELAQTRITTQAGDRRVLDEIDMISSVSGGSFTNAYFGLFGDDIFTDFKDAMLLRPIEGDLLKQLLNPGNWHNLASPYYGRSDMAATYYDEHIFKGKTFADIDPTSAPRIMINASDIGTGARMVFTRDFFNLLCVDYDTYPITRAVAASSGVPGATTPVTIQNHTGSCGYKLPAWILNTLKSQNNPILATRIDNYLDYLKPGKRPWLHLVDGGITDNLGLRQFYEYSNLYSNFERLFKDFTGAAIESVDDILIISVNAAVDHRWDWANQPTIPTEREALGAMTHIQMHNYTADTLHIVQDAYRQWQQETSQRKSAHFEFVEVSFNRVLDDKERAQLNELPTSLQLNEDQVNHLIDVGRRLLRKSPEFQQFLARHRQETESEQ